MLAAYIEVFGRRVINVLPCPKFGLLDNHSATYTNNSTDNVHFRDVATLHVLERDVRTRGGDDSNKRDEKKNSHTMGADEAAS